MLVEVILMVMMMVAMMVMILLVSWLEYSFQNHKKTIY
jgi:hypothetical protein